MALSYDEIKQEILLTLMGRPPGTEIQPQNHQKYSIDLLDYVRAVELNSNSAIIGIAYENTIPIEPTNSSACYIAGVAQDRTIVFHNFHDYNGNPITITNGPMEGCLVVMIWNGSCWSYEKISTNIISAAEQANFYYTFNIRKTYSSIAEMNADSDHPIGDDGRYIQKGELVSVENPLDSSENGIYSYTGSGWQYQSSFNFQIVQIMGDDPNVAMSQKALTEIINDIRATLFNLSAMDSYYVCDTSGSLGQKTIVSNDYTLGLGGSIKIKFDHANTGDDVSLKIGSADSKPLYYEGIPASSENTWGDGDVVEVFYDGTNYQAYNFKDEGGGVFSTGERVEDVGIEDFPTENSSNLITSGAVFNAILNIVNELEEFAEQQPVIQLIYPNQVADKCDEIWGDE
jgi:hypothetical protein